LKALDRLEESYEFAMPSRSTSIFQQATHQSLFAGTCQEGVGNDLGGMTRKSVRESEPITCHECWREKEGKNHQGQPSPGWRSQRLSNDVGPGYSSMLKLVETQYHLQRQCSKASIFNQPPQATLVLLA